MPHSAQPLTFGLRVGEDHGALRQGECVVHPWATAQLRHSLLLRSKGLML